MPPRGERLHVVLLDNIPPSFNDIELRFLFALCGPIDQASSVLIPRGNGLPSSGSVAFYRPEIAQMAVSTFNRRFISTETDTPIYNVSLWYKLQVCLLEEGPLHQPRHGVIPLPVTSFMPPAQFVLPPAPAVSFFCWPPSKLLIAFMPSPLSMDFTAALVAGLVR